MPTGAGPLTTEAMLESCLKLLTPAQQRILKVAVNHHPVAVNKQDLATMAGASATSSAFANNLGALRSAGMIDYVDRVGVKAADWIFVDGKASA